MSNTLLTPSVIAKEALMAFKNKLGFTSQVNKQYSDQFAKSGAKIGNSITIRKPPRFIVSSGPALSVQDVTEESTALTLSSQKHVDFKFSSQELTLTVDKFRERYIDNAVIALANQVDMDGMSLAALNVANSVGTPGTTPSALLTFLQAQQKLNEMGCPQDSKRSIFINPAAQAATVNALSGLFQSSSQIAEQYEKGMMGIAAGAKWYLGQNVNSRTVGPLGGTPLVNGASQTGSSLATKGWTAAAAARLNQGDVFTIAGVFSVNPITKQSTGSLQQFVVTSAFSSDGSGNGSVAIYPSISTSASGATQTVTASPADGAAITVVGSAGTASPQNILCHENAFTLGTADLELPGGVDFAAVASDDDTGLSIRVIRAYDINNDVFPCRLDILYGWASVRPEWACRIQG